MRLVCVSAATSPRQLIVNLRSLLFLTALLAFSLSPPAWAQTPADPSPDPQTESAGQDSRGQKGSDKQPKYDVDHIGQRGIGSGFNLYSLKHEQQLGRQLAASFDRSTKPITDEVVTEYINRLAQKIVLNSDAVMPFTVRVIDSGDVPRAYGLPGGFLYVDSALILVSDGEAELASVMAHEIAHVAARHATRALTRKHMCDILGSMAMLTGPAGLAAENVSGFAGPLSVKKFSRDSEYEADLLAVEYAYAAGYDPDSFLGALEKLHAIELEHNQNLAKIPGYHFASKVPFHSKIARGFANYPLTEERIQRLQSEIPTFLPGRKDYVLDTNEFEEIKARLLLSQTPVLRHHAGDEDNKGPVLRRTSSDDTSEGTPFRGFALFSTERAIPAQ